MVFNNYYFTLDRYISKIENTVQNFAGGMERSQNLRYIRMRKISL